jgi:hypothetical protein
MSDLLVVPWHLAQLNVGRPRGPMDGPVMAEFVARLGERGPSPEAFTFKQRFPAPGELGGPVNMRPEPYCAS